MLWQTGGDGLSNKGYKATARGTLGQEQQAPHLGSLPVDNLGAAYLASPMGFDPPHRLPEGRAYTQTERAAMPTTTLTDKSTGTQYEVEISDLRPVRAALKLSSEPISIEPEGGEGYYRGLPCPFRFKTRHKHILLSLGSVEELQAMLAEAMSRYETDTGR